MEISYSNKMLKKLKNEASIRKNYGKFSEKIKVCISILEGADNLEQVPNCPPTRRHKLTSGNWSIDLSANWRLIIKALDSDEPSTITKIELVDIEDYH